MKVARAFAVLAAALLVGAVAVGTLAANGMTLAEGLAAMDAPLAASERFMRAQGMGWVWDHPLRALLRRPAWLLPASFGIILAGVSATVASQGGAVNSRRRRS